MFRQIYLDHAAATPIDERVLQVMQPYFRDIFYNPSATYTVAKQAHQALEAARTQIAHWLGARSSEVIFTAGGTEANNLAIQGVMHQFPDAKLVVSSIEHESVLAPAHSYEAQEIGVKPDGRLDLNDLRRQVDDKTVLVSIMYANNEIGTIEPLRDVSRLLETLRHARQADGNDLPLYFHTDAAQAANYLDLHVARLGVDMMTINGGKIYGPKQSGALYVKSGARLEPQLLGGGQERNLRSGTENVAGAAGLAAALDLAQATRHAENERLHKLQEQLFTLLAEQIPRAVINGSQKYRLPNNVHVTIPGQDNERLLIQLDEAGILAAAGSACSASDEEPSHVLRALGLSDAEAQASLRLTMGRATTAEDIAVTVETLRAILQGSK